MDFGSWGATCHSLAKSCLLHVQVWEVKLLKTQRAHCCRQRGRVGLPWSPTWSGWAQLAPVGWGVQRRGWVGRVVNDKARFEHRSQTFSLLSLAVSVLKGVWALCWKFNLTNLFCSGFVSVERLKLSILIYLTWFLQNRVFLPWSTVIIAHLPSASYMPGAGLTI